jgi:hypothetical protein
MVYVEECFTDNNKINDNKINDNKINDNKVTDNKQDEFEETISVTEEVDNKAPPKKRGRPKKATA